MNCDKKDLIVFGDEYNDIEMFVFVGKGYVMKNVNLELFFYVDE